MSRLRLQVLGADTVLASTLCARCPHSPGGCCVAPPRYDWSDLARVVAHGHRDWLVARVRAGDLRPIVHGLVIARPPGRLTIDTDAPPVARCTFHRAGHGCTIDEEQRPATCNFYLCDQALDDAEDPAEASRARQVQAELVDTLVRRDAALARRLQDARNDEAGDGRFDADFFDALAAIAAEHAAER